MREPKLMVVTGMVGVGKTHQTTKEIMAMLRGGPNIAPRNVLAFDPNNRDYTNLPSLYYDVEDEDKTMRTQYLRNFSASKAPKGYRILAITKSGEEMTIDQKMRAFEDITTHGKNCTILLEDMNNYVTNFDSNFIVSRLTTYRHRNTDLIVHLQSLGALRPRLWQGTKIVRMHHELDDVSRMRDRLEGRYAILKIAQIIVSYRYERGEETDNRDLKSFFVYVDMEKKKILGNYSMEEFVRACTIFLNENRNEFLKNIVYTMTDSPKHQHWEKARYTWIQQNRKMIS